MSVDPAFAGRVSIGEAAVPLIVEICSEETAVRETQMLAHKLLGQFTGMAGWCMPRGVWRSGIKRFVNHLRSF